MLAIKGVSTKFLYLFATNKKYNIPRLPLLQLDFVINGKPIIMSRAPAVFLAIFHSMSDPGIAFNVTYFFSGSCQTATSEEEDHPCPGDFERIPIVYRVLLN